ncbi:copper homeostasis protein CutC [Propioniciclava coleopterorum]|uniref:PF03932 family protein CutC n=1 Tax=Propioniciclava coleopterorum TaxID=2714937 RepID=A0A6G7Y3U8_9ACTN|nr:copper homeostasis protein CutC [Propioniciclava coleopterorum]QIK71301.1 copper homeostasis protein CutC [Propioniciclava coleopterorum]
MSGKTDRIPLEIAVQDAAGALAALAAGADRLELCSALETGGLTPSLGLVERVAAAAAEAGAGLCVLIRARDGDFVYDADEVAVMRRDVALTAAVPGVTGVVVGALTASGGVDAPAVRALADAAAGRDVVFHRALDVLADPLAALDELARLGVTRVLTSGGAPTAPEGLETLRAMAAHASGLGIVAGGGVTPAAFPALLDAGVTGLHLSAKHRRPGGASGPGGGAGEVWRTSAAAVREARDALDRAAR